VKVVFLRIVEVMIIYYRNMNITMSFFFSKNIHYIMNKNNINP